MSYVVDPQNPYPANFTGHIRAQLKNGAVREVRRAHMRGGAHQPLSAQEIAAKFSDNARFGGWPADRANSLAAALARISEGAAVDLRAARA